eukprot:scaffold1189_cov315-Prasinococcus_capsulatus_cf.AAC.6
MGWDGLGWDAAGAVGPALGVAMLPGAAGPVAQGRERGGGAGRGGAAAALPRHGAGDAPRAAHVRQGPLRRVHAARAGAPRAPLPP